MKLILTLLSIVFTISVVSCVSSEKSEEKSWSGSMQDLSKELVDIMPYIYSQKDFYDKENYKKIKLSISKFVQASHEVSPKQGKKFFGDDPIIQYSLRQLNNDMQLAYRSFESGKVEFANDMLRQSLNTCFQCHTRANVGPEFKNLKLNLSGLRMTPLEKADVHVALRQYDEALEILKSEIVSPASYYERPFVIEKALEKYLALMVRVKKNYPQAITTLDRFNDRDSLPVYLTDKAKAWRKSLVYWNNKTLNKKDLNKLMTRSEKLQDEVSYQAGFVENLIASNLLHELISQSKNATQKAKYYHQLGEIYESLIDLGFWSLPESYYEACVKEVPKTAMAKKCFRDYERNILMGFSGSAGVFIPEDEQQKIKELRSIAY